MVPRLGHLFLLVFVAAPAWGADWPAWRGPSGDGHCAEKNLPLRWSTQENVRWKVPLPDAGNSTPAIWGERVFLTQATDKGTRRSLLCLARGDGRLLWKREVSYPDKESTHGDNPYCSASPATDGERVVVSHGSAGLFCYDLDGQELWKKDLGKLEHIWGNASSPILHGKLAILWCGPGARQFLLAVDKKSGETVWEHQEPGGKFGDQSSDWLGSWSTPIIAKVNGRDELLLGVPHKLKAFDPATGKELWSCTGLGPLVYTSPVYADGIVIAMSGYGGAAMAVRAGGDGDVTQSRRLWHHTKSNPQRIGSPIIVGPHLYIVNESGKAQCFDLSTGKESAAKDRLAGKSWSSMVAADGHLYVTTMDGDTFVLSADPKMEVLARNPLGEKILSSIAVSNGDLFIRTYKHLWCIAEKKP